MSFNRSGYIGRAPGDSSVTIARKSYEPTGVKTDFTFSAGYDPGYCDVYLNGIRLVKDNDFTASDGSTVGLTSAANSGDVVEIVAYKAFNLGQSITDITGDLTITDTLTATNVSGTTSVTAGYLYGDGSNITGLSYAGIGITQYIDANSLTVTGSPGLTTITRLGATDAVVTGIITANGLSGNVSGVACTFTTGTFNGNVSIAGSLTYEDVTSVDSVGLITARAGIAVTGGQLLVGSGITMGIAGVATFSGTSDVHLLDNVKLNVGDSNDFQVSHDGSDTTLNNTSGHLKILCDQTIRFADSGNNEAFAVFTDNGSVDLYYDNSKKFETTNDGTVTTGIGTFSNRVCVESAGTFLKSNQLSFYPAGNAFIDHTIEGHNITLRVSSPGGSANDTNAVIVGATGITTFSDTPHDDKGDLRSIPLNTQGSTYTLVAADAGKAILASGTVTVPNSVFSAGDAVTIINNTGSNLTITKTITTMYNASDATSTNRTLATRGTCTIYFESGTVAYISGAGLS